MKAQFSGPALGIGGIAQSLVGGVLATERGEKACSGKGGIGRRHARDDELGEALGEPCRVDSSGLEGMEETVVELRRKWLSSVGTAVGS